MNFSEKLRTLRKQYKFSQEQLAEKIGVSRQAITKWETDGGLPDIENLMAIAALFSISIDELLSNEKLAYTVSEYAYESTTEFDIDRLSHFDIHAPGAQEVSVTVTDDEKMRIRLASNVLQALAQNYKVKLDEHRNRLDVDIRQSEKSSEAEGKEALSIHICLPARFCSEVELSAIADVLRLDGLTCPFELSGKVRKVDIKAVQGTIALNCNTDMVIYADALPAALEINQINATSTLHIPQGSKFYTRIKGESNKVIFMQDGKPTGYQGDADAANRIELAGMNAELTVSQYDA
ncbi:MAG: helix-turn-helix domain-containing protein [Coriobacteriia bacterium]|nr:helix-turn-helix domain-containing protein [Coriobacteriia bacterium]